MAVGLLGGDPALIDQGLHEGVVLGDLRQLTVAQQVAARVADMNQSQPVTGEQDRGKSGAHSVQLGINLDVLGDRRVALVHSRFQLAQQIATGFVVIEMGEGGDHQLRRHFAGGVTTHAVGEGQQPGTGVHRVFVVGADESTIAAGGVAQGQCHGRSSITVLPTWTGVPRGTRMAVVTLDRSR